MPDFRFQTMPHFHPKLAFGLCLNLVATVMIMRLEALADYQHHLGGAA
jgi:hypothetical protein